MFVLASHLWLRDKSVSVTQLNCLQGQTLWQFYGVKLCFFKNSSQTKKENEVEHQTLFPLGDYPFFFWIQKNQCFCKQSKSDQD